MQFGNMPLDGGHLLLKPDEKDEILRQEPNSEKFVKTFIGAKELLNDQDKYCIFIDDTLPSIIKKEHPFIWDRVVKVRDFRLASKRKQTQECALTFYLFGEIRFFADKSNENLIIIPRVSSERRRYIPMVFVSNDVIPGDTCLAIHNPTLYHFGVLTSAMHMAWVNAVCGRLESRYRYSKDIVYNNFIWPEATDAQKTEIEKLSHAVLDARAEFPDASLADLYDPLTMPPNLAKAHKALDKAVDKLYRHDPFKTDPDRVSLLFQKYQEATA
jgi:hypothetical protein